MDRQAVVRSGWDSNPRALSSKRISSAPRYDRFDTAPYTLSVMHRDNHCIIAQLPTFGKHKSRGNSALPPFLKYIGNTAV